MSNIARYAVGKAIKTRRNELNLSMRQVCAKSYTSLGFLSEIERGVKDPSTVILESIISALELSVPSFYMRVAREAETLNRVRAS